MQSTTDTFAAAPGEPILPLAPLLDMVSGAHVTVSGDMDLAALVGLLPITLTTHSSTELLISGANGLSLDLTGSNFSYIGGFLIGGTVLAAHLTEVVSGQTAFQLDVTGLNINAATLEATLLHDAMSGVFSALLSNGASIVAGPGADLIRGALSNDLISGSGGADTLTGGAGDDVIFATSASGTLTSLSHTYLRGEDGNDYIVGGQGFDDINGNAGADTVSGGQGADWVVGGRDNDLLFGDEGADIVYGNLGNDTLDGGADNDVVRGGQGDDALFGGAGADWLSGDVGADTLVGGTGADTFHTFATAGLDRVLDFSAPEGDRVQVDAGSTYSLSQQGADTIIDFGGGNQMVLVGVQLSSLPSGWIFTG
jgi:serralysin